MDTAKHMMTLSEAMEETGNYQEALEFLSRAEKIYLSRGEIGYTSCMLNRANINTQLGHIEQAKKEYEEHVRILLAYIDRNEGKTNTAYYTNQMLHSVERLGRLYFQKKDFEKSISLLTFANEMYSRLLRKEPVEALYYRGYVNTFEILGDVLFAAKQFDKASVHYNSFYGKMNELAKLAPSSMELQFDLARALGKLGAIHMERSQFNLSIIYYKQALRHIRKYSEFLSHLPEVQREYATMLTYIGTAYLAIGKKRAAKKCFSASKEMMRELCLEFPGSIWYTEIFTLSLNKMGDMLVSSQMYEEALECYQECLRQKSELAAEKPDIVQMKTGLAVVHQNIGDVYRMQGQYDNALLHYTQFYELTKAIMDYQFPYPDQRRMLAIAMGRLAMIDRINENHQSALQHLENSYRLRKELYKEFPLNTLYKDDLSIAFQDLADIYLLIGEIRKSLFCFLKYYRLQSALAARFPESMDYHAGVVVAAKHLGTIYMSIGKQEEASYFLEEFRLLQQENFAAQEIALSYEVLGHIFTGLGLYNEAFNAYWQFYTLMKTATYQEHDAHSIRLNQGRSAWKLALCYKIRNDDEHAIPAFAEAKNHFNELIRLYPDKEEYLNDLQLIREQEQIPVNVPVRDTATRS